MHIYVQSRLSHLNGNWIFSSCFVSPRLSRTDHSQAHQKKPVFSEWSHLRPCINQIATEPNTTFTTLFFFYRPLMNKPQSSVTWLNFSHFLIYFLWPRRLSIFHQPQYFAEWPESILLLFPLINK